MNLNDALQKVRAASRKLVLLDESEVEAVLTRLADGLEKGAAQVLEANARDLAKIDKEDHVCDRIQLTEERIKDIADSVRDIAGYESPIDEVLEEKKLENGLELSKVRVPIGVVGAIFEARPNVLIDTFALCFKSRNACVMKGGSQCEESNGAMMDIVLKSLEPAGLLDCTILLSNDRAVTAEFLKMDKFVDVIVPRGGQGLIDYVRENSLIPVIETGRGVCHTYVDESADIKMAKAIVANAKMSRPSVCNALDTLIVHESVDVDAVCADLEGVEICEEFGTEFLSLKMSIKKVASLDEAIEHINEYGSGHSEAIITEDQDSADKFMKAVDAACVYVNASTRFTDGGVFGLGAEVGISTQKLHARGPMGIKELTSYKWKVVGSGQVR